MDGIVLLAGLLGLFIGVAGTILYYERRVVPTYQRDLDEARQRIVEMREDGLRTMDLMMGLTDRVNSLSAEQLKRRSSPSPLTH
jgi:hypothetical protein